LLLSYDFVFYSTHYAMHRIPALWVLHRIHHSAEVLTPLTRYREHFLAGPIWTAGSGFSYGVAAGLFAYLFSGGITEATVLNIGFFFLLFGFNGSFRHYHVQFHYPRWLSKWLHSPAMHHIHHSYLPQHWDRNFAAVTSLWDRLFGTLYIPSHRTTTAPSGRTLALPSATGTECCAPNPALQRLQCGEISLFNFQLVQLFTGIPGQGVR
jgi:sterol desaturase/sphingolipid hydroxylase (fatty acid hydroxylase superfamily)